MYNTKNYTEQGGEKTVIGGEIDFTGATITGFPEATATAEGTVKMAANIAVAAGAAPTKTEYDALLAALKAAGIMVADV